MVQTKPKDYKIRFADQFLFDTNIWLLLYGTFADFQKQDQKEYSRFFSDIISKQNPIFITSTIISEFANVILRHDFKQWITVNKLYNQDFKRHFVGSNEYQDSVTTITQLINKILSLPNIIKVSDDFSLFEKQKVLNNFKIVDFNDAYTASLCEKRNYLIVTNDKDFLKLTDNITVLTT
jgi:predicted nucleic acid-binding protein